MKKEHVLSVTHSTDSYLTQLEKAAVQLNDRAKEIVENLQSSNVPTSQAITLIECTSADLGLQNGGYYEEILSEAQLNGLLPCSLEKGILFRLQYLAQPTSSNAILSKQEAPDAAITIASPHDFTGELIEGFYLRNVEGVNWLRAYQASIDYLWKPTDRFLFQKGE